MNHKKILKKIIQIEKKYIQLKNELVSQNIFKSNSNSYLKKDKQDFIIFWNKFIELFDELQDLLKKTRYRRLFFFINYNKLVLRKYTVHLYYKVISDLLKIFGNHNKYIRILLEENFKNDFGVYAKYIYKPKYINIYNTPILFIEPFKNRIDKDIQKLMYKIKTIKSTKRIGADYDNLFFWVKNKSDILLYKIIRFIGNIIANTRFTKRKYGLISQENLNKYIKISKPGDILLSRGNWNASNISIPGFWKHMAIYIGTGKYIKNNYKGEFLSQLEYKNHYIIEATSKGINIKTIQNYAYMHDYIGVSRTKFSKEKIKRSINNALSSLGKEYDFIFNYYSDKRMVCSALVLKSFAKEFDSDEGIDIELEKISIGLAYIPNNFIKKLNEEKQKNHPEVEGIFFIDSSEKKGISFINTIEELLKSGDRPRFSILQK